MQQFLEPTVELAIKLSFLTVYSTCVHNLLMAFYKATFPHPCPSPSSSLLKSFWKCKNCPLFLETLGKLHWSLLIMKQLMFPAPLKGWKDVAILAKNVNHADSAVNWSYTIWSSISLVIIIYALSLDMTHKSFLLYYIFNIPEHSKISLLSINI